MTGISVSSSTADIENSELNVTGIANVTGLNSITNATVNITNSNISVVSTGANANVRALMTNTEGSIQMELGELSFTSLSPNAVIASGSMISLFGVTCTINGSAVTCP